MTAVIAFARNCLCLQLCWQIITIIPAEKLPVNRLIKRVKEIQKISDVSKQTSTIMHLRMLSVERLTLQAGNGMIEYAYCLSLSRQSVLTGSYYLCPGLLPLPSATFALGYCLFHGHCVCPEMTRIQQQINDSRRQLQLHDRQNA